MNEYKESVTHRENLRDNKNDTQNDNREKIKQYYELGDNKPNAPTTGVNLFNN